MSKKGWEGLSKYQQEIINTACRDTMWWALVRSDAKQVPAMRELEKKGVTFVKWKARVFLTHSHPPSDREHPATPKKIFEKSHRKKVTA